jgi:hypothetical protein
MKDEVTPAMITKLPKWAQDHITNLARERDVALRALNDHINDQTPSPVYWEEYLSTGEGTAGKGIGPSNKRFYVQTDRLVVEAAGVQLQIYCRESSPRHYDCIELKWSDPFCLQNMTGFIPHSFQSAYLVAHHNMRVRPIHPSTCKQHKFREEKFCTECGWRHQL